MSRIEVEYTTSELNGERRWLDTATGELYKSTDDQICCNYRFRPGFLPGEYTNNISVVRLVKAELPVEVSGAPYPDGNPKSIQGAKKYSLRYFPLPANIAVNQALEDGAKKYGPANWREKGVATSVYIDAALRHISQYFDGKQDKAADSGVHNLGHAMACLAIIIDAEANGTLQDDRPFACADTDALLKRG